MLRHEVRHGDLELPTAACLGRLGFRVPLKGSIEVPLKGSIGVPLKGSTGVPLKRSIGVPLKGSIIGFGVEGSEFPTAS